MSVLVAQQDETINAIDTQAAKVEEDTRQGYVFLHFFPTLPFPSTMFSSEHDSIQRILINTYNRSLQQTEKAVVHARAARRKRWICFFLFLLICAILAIVLGVVFGKK